MLVLDDEQYLLIFIVIIIEALAHLAGVGQIIYLLSAVTLKRINRRNAEFGDNVWQNAVCSFFSLTVTVNVVVRAA